jgi:hypothetical protein
MRVIRNERHIRVRSFVGKYAVLAGMLSLVAGLIISFTKPELLLPLLLTLPLGLFFSIVGTFFADRYAGPLAHHQALAEALKGLDNRHVLLQYLFPASHVLLEPGGLITFVVKTHRGQVTCQGEGRWKHRQRGKAFRQFAGQEGLGIPDYEAASQARKLERWLSKNLPDVEVPVRAAIVFVSPDVQLDADASPIPAFYGKKVKAWLRGPGKLKPLPKDVYRQLVEVMGTERETSRDASEKDA